MADASKTESMVYCNVTEIDHYVHDVRLNFQWGKQSCHIPKKVNFAEQKKEMFLSSRDVVLEMSSNLKSQISNLKAQFSDTLLPWWVVTSVIKCCVLPRTDYISNLCDP